MDKNGDGRIQYVILEGEMGHQDAIVRTESVTESMKNNGLQIEKTELSDSKLESCPGAEPYDTAYRSV